MANLNRRLIVLMEQEDYDLLERMAQQQNLATSTFARGLVLAGMIDYRDRAAAAKPARKRAAR